MVTAAGGKIEVDYQEGKEFGRRRLGFEEHRGDTPSDMMGSLNIVVLVVATADGSNKATEVIVTVIVNNSVMGEGGGPGKKESRGDDEF